MFPTKRADFLFSILNKHIGDIRTDELIISSGKLDASKTNEILSKLPAQGIGTWNILLLDKEIVKKVIDANPDMKKAVIFPLLTNKNVNIVLYFHEYGEEIV